MFQPNKLLKVSAIITIIQSVLGIISGIFGLAVGGAMTGEVKEQLEAAGQDAEMLTSLLSPTTMIISIVISVLLIVCSVLALKGRNYKACMLMMILYIVYSVIELIRQSAMIGFSITSVIGFIVPILFLWGLYQSKE